MTILQNCIIKCLKTYECIMNIIHLMIYWILINYYHKTKKISVDFVGIRLISVNFGRFRWISAFRGISAFLWTLENHVWVINISTMLSYTYMSCVPCVDGKIHPCGFIPQGGDSPQLKLTCSLLCVLYN